MMLGGIFYDGDHFHPKENVEKMSNSIPLTDTDREVWLLQLCELIKQHQNDTRVVVIACSALKEKYRHLLRSAGSTCRGGIHFIYLKGPYTLIEQRLLQRQGHFMKASLLQSQFETLEEPTGQNFPKEFLLEDIFLSSFLQKK
jgi:gluconokinase